MDPKLLLEACALGNLEVVAKLVGDGVDVNWQHPMNGWTSLHWAAKRNQLKVVKYLLDNGADLNLKNDKNQLAFQLSANNEIIELLKSPEAPSEQHSLVEEKLSFVPSYIRTPVHSRELESLETEIIESKIANAEIKDTHSIEPESQKEIFVYLNIVTDENLLGSINLLSTDLIDRLVESIKAQLDNVPSEFTLLKYNEAKAKAIPINTKQYDMPLDAILQMCDTVIIKPNLA